MQRPPPVDPPQDGAPSRPALFLAGAAGLPIAVAAGVAGEALLGGGGRVSSAFFVTAAALVPVFGLGLLVQLVGTLAGRTRGLLDQLKRFNEEMEAEPPQLSEDGERERRAAWEGASRFVYVLAPFAAGLAVQLVITEAVAVYCIVAGVDERGVAIAVGVQVFALFNYLLFFGPLLRRLGARGSAVAAG